MIGRELDHSHNASDGERERDRKKERETVETDERCTKQLIKVMKKPSAAENTYIHNASV